MRISKCSKAGAVTLVSLITFLSPPPAEAAFVNYTISGTLNGSQTTFTCAASLGGCPELSSFTRDFGFFASLDLSPGTNTFSLGSPFVPFGAYSGTIVSDGTLTGLDLTWGYSSCSPGPPSVGCFVDSGSAPTFTVQAGEVPEAPTWMLMLLGFGLAAWNIRRADKGKAAAEAAS